MVGRTRLAVRREQSLLGYVLALYPDGVALMVDAVARLAAGRALPREAQSPTAGAYYTYPTAAEWAEFARRGCAVATPEDVHATLGRFGPRATS